MTGGRFVVDENSIDVWLAFYHEIEDARLLASLRELLNEEERCREPRFHFAADRKRYLVTRALVRTVLSRYAEVAPKDWTFSSNDYGRPRIAEVHDAARGLSFNVSHTRGLIALGVTRGRELGVDVEHTTIREVSSGIAERFFAPCEVDALATVPPDRRQDRFFEYWTFKESYIKARGMGLSIPLDGFGFHFPHERSVGLAIEPELGDDASRWAFWQYRPAPHYLLAICAERRDAQAPRVVLRRTVPNLSDEFLALPLLRTSL
jgi:4'-phosphopantetheinyl transferase